MKDKKKLQRGITLIELLLGLMIILILISVYIAIFFKQDSSNLSKRTEAVNESSPSKKINDDILTIQNALKKYKLDNGFYPTSAQGLAALVEKPTTEPIPKNWVQYLKGVPLDPWGRVYHYENPGKSNEVKIYIEKKPDI